MDTAKLILFRDGKKIREESLSGELQIGRGPSCDIRLDDQGISRHHATVALKEGQLEVVKRSEFGPLWVNGREVSQAILKQGDVFRMGSFDFEFQLERKSEDVRPSLPTAEVLTSIPTVDLGQVEEVQLVSEENSPAVTTPTPSSDFGIQDGPEVDLHLDLDASPQTPIAEPMVIESPKSFELEPSQSQLSAQVSDEAQTRLVSASKMEARLLFKTGTASVETFAVRGEETSIGRSKNCDIVILDKKSSRRNTVIVRKGIQFFVRDLDSSNGTYLNGVRITEAELTGDDELRIGDTSFDFEIVSAEFEKKKEDLFVPKEEPEIELPPPAMESAAAQNAIPAGEFSANKAPWNAPLGGTGAIPGLGLPSNVQLPSPGKTSLLAKYRQLPPRKRILYLAVAVAAIWFLLDEEPGGGDKKVAEKSVDRKVSSEGQDGGAGGPTYESLTKEQRGFVESQYQLASNFYYNKEYDKSLFEIRKIFQLVPEYKNSREIERYAEEGKRRMEAQERERRRKEEEARIRAEVADLIEKARNAMIKKKYKDASGLFPQILSLDPENKDVARWQNEMDTEVEQQRLQEQQVKVQDEINKYGWDLYKKGVEEYTAGRFPQSVATLTKIEDIGSTDAKLKSQSKEKITEAELKLKELLEPMAAEAKAAEDASDYSKAYKLYESMKEADSRDSRGIEGMNRIRGILHERGKVQYIEAVLAESYSDFENARQLFESCKNAAPKEDIYFQRCSDKLERYKAFDIKGSD